MLLARGALVAAVVALLSFGLLGVGRSGGLANTQADMRYLHVAGRMLARGVSPYDAEEFQRTAKQQFDFDAYPFGYPPQIAPLALTLSILPFRLACALMALLNLVSTAAVAWIAVRLWAQLPYAVPEPGGRLLAALSASAIIGNPFTAHVLWMGQTSAIAAACLLGAWYAIGKGKQIAAGMLIGAASLKPQLAVLFILWLLFDRQWRVLMVGGLFALLLASYPMATIGPIEIWHQWLRALGQYVGGEVTGWQHLHVFGLGGVLSDLGVKPIPLFPAAVACAGCTFLYRKCLGADLVPGLLFCISALFIYAHDYDLMGSSVLAVPLLGAVWPRPYLRGLVLVLAATLFFPSRIWDKLDLEAMVRTREVALLGLAFIAAYTRLVPGAERITESVESENEDAKRALS